MAQYCQACEDGDHAFCGMQTWCECECDPENCIDISADHVRAVRVSRLPLAPKPPCPPDLRPPDAPPKVRPGDTAVTVEGVVMSITEKAVMVGEKAEGFGEWYPFSQMVDRDFDPDELEVGEEICFEIPRWLAREKGLI